VFAFDFDNDTGKFSNERVIVDVTDGSAPDGMTIDKDDFIWVAHWGGSRITRYNGITGAVDKVVKIPGAKNITSCCFGGENLDTLYITTSHLLTDLNEFPNAGKLFSVQIPGISGVPMVPFRRT